MFSFKDFGYMFRIESFLHQTVKQGWEKFFHLTFYASAMTFKGLIFFVLVADNILNNF